MALKEGRIERLKLGWIKFWLRRRLPGHHALARKLLEDEARPLDVDAIDLLLDHAERTGQPAIATRLLDPLILNSRLQGGDYGARGQTISRAIAILGRQDAGAVIEQATCLIRQHVAQIYNSGNEIDVCKLLKGLARLLGEQPGTNALEPLLELAVGMEERAGLRTRGVGNRWAMCFAESRPPGWRR